MIRMPWNECISCAFSFFFKIMPAVSRRRLCRCALWFCCLHADGCWWCCHLIWNITLPSSSQWLTILFSEFRQNYFAAQANKHVYSEILPSIWNSVFFCPRVRDFVFFACLFLCFCTGMHVRVCVNIFLI